MQRRVVRRAIAIADKDKIAGHRGEECTEVFGAEEWRDVVVDAGLPNHGLGCLHGRGDAGTAVDGGRKFVGIADNPGGTVGRTDTRNKFPHAAFQQCLDHW